MAAIILAVGFVGLTIIAQDLANTGFDAIREEARSLVREYDNAKARFGVALEHESNHGNQSLNAEYLVTRGFDRLVANYTELEASRRTHLDATYVSMAEDATSRRVEVEVDLLFEDEFTRVEERTNFTYDLYLTDEWWDDGTHSWDFRIPVALDSRLLKRTDYGVEARLNLTQAVERADRAGTAVDTSSIRVVEVSATGGILGEVTPRGVTKLPGFDAATDARVLLVWNMSGVTGPGQPRWYHIYFDDAAQGTPVEGVLRFYDSFERDKLGSNWTNSNKATSTNESHSGDRSWEAHNGISPTLDIVSVLGNEKVDGVLEVWFYDRDPTDTNIDSWAQVHVEDSSNGTLLLLGVGADEDVTGKNYSLDLPWEGGQVDSHFPRSKGWHRFTFSMNSTHLNIYLDQKRVAANNTLAPYTYDDLTFTHVTGHAKTWWDDVALYEGVIVSRVHPVDQVLRWPQRAP